MVLKGCCIFGGQNLQTRSYFSTSSSIVLDCLSQKHSKPKQIVEPLALMVSTINLAYNAFYLTDLIIQSLTPQIHSQFKITDLTIQSLTAQIYFQAHLTDLMIQSLTAQIYFQAHLTDLTIQSLTAQMNSLIQLFIH